MKPSVGRIVHYVSYGTPGGEYGKECRAAIVTEVEGPGADDAERVGLCVLNPAGQFFNRSVPQHEHDGDVSSEAPGLHPGGTWHWPERV